MLIASAHPYRTRKFTRHLMHQARTLSTKINNDRADGTALALVGFNDLGDLVTPTFLSRKRCYLQVSPNCQKMNKTSMWEVTKNSRFLSMGYQILSSCGCKVGETMVTKC